MERKLFVAQRLSAMVLAPLVLIHLGLILYAVRSGLSGEEILARTEGNVLWAGFYVGFVLVAAIHAPIGLRNILREWTAIPGQWVSAVCLICAAGFIVLGLRAVVAVI